MFLRTYCILVLGLDLVVGLVFDNLQNFGTGNFSTRLQRDSRVEWPSEHYFLNCQAEGSNAMNSADIRTSPTCKCDLLVPVCPSLHTLLHPIRVLLVIHGIAGFSSICPEFDLVHLSSFGIVPCVEGMVIVDLLLRVYMSSSVRTSLSNHVIPNRQGIKALSIQLTHGLHVAQANHKYSIQCVFAR